MKVLISAGGTGGHINPAIAIGKYIKFREPTWEILFIGSKGNLEKKLYDACGMKYKLFQSQGLDRKKILKNFKILYNDYNAYKNIDKTVKDFKPDIGIGAGGYISALAMKSLKKRNIPFIIHEQNAYPGLTTRILSKDAHFYALAFGEANSYLKYPKRGVVTGNPVRKEFLTLTKKEARKQLGFCDNEKIVLCFGGSLGALKINECIVDVAKKIKDTDNITLIIATGSRFYNDFKQKLSNQKHVILKEYIDNMPLFLIGCDLAITRAGAMTISEICVTKKPSILIPSPNVTADHQTKNANVLSSVGGAENIAEKDLTSEVLYDTIIGIVNNENKINKMQKSLETLRVADADMRIYELLKKTLNGQP